MTKRKPQAKPLTERQAAKALAAFFRSCKRQCKGSPLAAFFADCAKAAK